MIPSIPSIRLHPLAERTANCLLRALALLLAAGPPARYGCAASGADPAAAPVRRSSRRRSDTWRQLAALNDATLRDIGMTRPALGQYLVDPRPDASVSGKASSRNPACARAAGPPRTVRAGI